MISSVFSTLWNYLQDVWWSVRSVLTSCFTAIPYLFSAGEERKEVTEQYPDPISSRTADDLPPRSRGLLYNDIERCTGCRECELTCPVQCIGIAAEPGAESEKLWVSSFKIDFSKCVFCGLCVESCEPQSLVHTKQYEGAVYSLESMVSEFGRGEITAQQRERWAKMRKQNDEETSL